MHKKSKLYAYSHLFPTMVMPIAFSESADFSGMIGNRDLFITDATHKALISVDEAGTEAAPASAVVMPASMSSGQLVEITVDRPFISLIRDIDTGSILLAGRVINSST